MRQYVVRRLLLFFPAVVGATLVVFVLVRIMPGDVAMLYLVGPGGAGAIDPAQVTALREQLGLNRPWPAQYAEWIWGVVRLDLGESYWTRRPVAVEIADRFPATLELALLSMLIGILIAAPTGILSAVRQDTWVDYLFRIVSIGGISLPNFWIGTLVLIFLVRLFRWTPPSGLVSPFENPWVNFQQIIFPALIMGYYWSAVLSRMVRSSMLEVLRQDFIKTARAKGLRERVVISRHALRNAVLPVITIIGIQFGIMLGGIVIMEDLFTLPGVGRFMLQSLTYRDYTVLQAVVVFITLAYLAVNFLVDIAYALIDPRIKY